MFVVLLDITAAGVFVIVFEGGIYLGHGYACGIEFLGIDSHLIFFDKTAPAADFSQPFCAGKLFAYYPVLNCSQLRKRIFVLVSLFRPYCVMIYLTKPRGYGTKRSFSVHGKVIFHFFQLLTHLLTRPVDVGIIVKDKSDDR